MAMITIPKKEYQKLMEKSLRYDFLRHAMKADLFGSPPIKNRDEVIKSFRNSKKYSKEFLKSLEKGLSRSSYFNA